MLQNSIKRDSDTLIYGDQTLDIIYILNIFQLNASNMTFLKISCEGGYHFFKSKINNYRQFIRIKII